MKFVATGVGESAQGRAFGAVENREALILQSTASSPGGERNAPGVVTGKRVNVSIRVVVAESHAMLRSALKLLLEKHGFEVVGKAKNCYEAVEMARSGRPQMLVMDSSMLTVAGAAQIHKEAGVQLILLTRNAEDPRIIETLNAGVARCIVKSRAATELVPAMREVLRGASARREWFRTDVLTLRGLSEERGTRVNMLFRFRMAG